jgi:hypothetical protein
VPTAALDIRAQTQPTLNDNEGIVRHGLGVRVRHHCLCLGTCTSTSVPTSPVGFLFTFPSIHIQAEASWEVRDTSYVDGRANPWHEAYHVEVIKDSNIRL